MLDEGALARLAGALHEDDGGFLHRLGKGDGESSGVYKR